MCNIFSSDDEKTKDFLQDFAFFAHFAMKKIAKHTFCVLAIF